MLNAREGTSTACLKLCGVDSSRVSLGHKIFPDDLSAPLGHARMRRVFVRASLRGMNYVVFFVGPVVALSLN